MTHPTLDHAAKRFERRPSVVDADHRVVGRLALPIEVRIVLVEHVKLDALEAGLPLHYHPPDAAVSVTRRMHLDRLEVGEQDGALLQVEFLVAEEEFRG